METSNHFTCLSYDTVDFLIPSQYVLFGIYLEKDTDEKNVLFENETLPHINIGGFLEEQFNCKSIQDCSVMMVMNKDDFSTDVQKHIVAYTETEFPVSGNLAVSVNSEVTSKIIDIQNLKPLPKGIRPGHAFLFMTIDQYKKGLRGSSQFLKISQVLSLQERA